MYRGKWFSLAKLKILGLGCGTDFDLTLNLNPNYIGNHVKEEDETL